MPAIVVAINLGIAFNFYGDNELLVPKGILRTPSNIYDGVFFAKIVNRQKLLTIFPKSFIMDV